MPMHSFIDAFPELGYEECRSIHVVKQIKSLSLGSYALQEMYCDDRECDCRRVSLNVVCQETGEMMCVVSYGFDRDEPLAGPFLDPLYPRPDCAYVLLDLIKDMVLSDPDYVARLERHYRMYKDSLRRERRLAQRLNPAGLTPRQVAERISERKHRHKMLRRAQRRPPR